MNVPTHLILDSVGFAIYNIEKLFVILLEKETKTVHF